MAYKKIKPYKYTIEELKELWSKLYCEQPIVTFDGIKVKFYSNMFDHVFYESDNRRAKDKSLLSYNRLEKIHWIKAALEDANSTRKKGWDRDSKTYNDTRRVTIVKGNYIVVILIYKEKKARFITAYEVTDKKNLELILNSPDWT